VLKIQRLAAVSTMAALTVALAACGGSEAPAAEAPAPSSAPAAAPMTSAPMAAGDGMTEISDIFGPACSQVPTEGEGSAEGMADDPVATAASNNPLLTTLVTAVGQVPGLAETLNSQEAITVFAPANPAFDAVQQQMGEEQFNALLADTETLQTVLSYHVVPQRMDAEGLVAAGEVTELAGGTVTIGGTPEAPTVTDGMGNTANVLCGNVPTANATVFVIDKVLMPAG
jgi:uncharacterized surface protein with fasciclin (FAS1) repeats